MQKHLSKLLNRVMKDEPDAKPIEFEGVRIWKVKREEEDITLSIDEGFSDFGNNKKKKAEPVEASEERRAMA